jgi:uncharacterized protein YdeI (YjbR/CyaY-like superfamily)
MSMVHADAVCFEDDRAFETWLVDNRFAFLHRIQTAVRPETRSRRIEQLTDALAQGKTPYPAPTKKPGI